MKILYVVLSNNGDGSSSPKFTFDKDVIEELREQEENQSIDYERWVGGDGLNLSVLNVPDECTYENMGILYPLTVEDI